MEVVAVVDTGRPLVETYALEGDEPLLVKCYGQLGKVSTSFSTVYYPNTKAIARATAAESGNPALNRLSWIMQLMNPASQRLL